ALPICFQGLLPVAEAGGGVQAGGVGSPGGQGSEQSAAVKATAVKDGDAPPVPVEPGQLPGHSGNGAVGHRQQPEIGVGQIGEGGGDPAGADKLPGVLGVGLLDRKSTRLNSSHVK